LLDYVEVIGRGQALRAVPAPFIAIPTTAGTGAEVTRNAVLASPAHQVKVSLRSPLMLPALAIVDPELTRDLPSGLTATTGLDALTQLIEPFLCRRANPFTDGFCQTGLICTARSLRTAVQQGDNAAAREDMALASVLGGLALANAGLGAVHGLAAPIGGQFPAPHGAVCAALLPHALEINLRALRQREPHNPALPRFDRLAGLLTDQPVATADAGIGWVRALVADLPVPGLGHYGLTPADFPGLIAKAANASSMKANPITLTADELAEILHRAL
jgi:alcohol dehydrogenase class IV